jgi:hypothetical protein
MTGVMEKHAGAMASGPHGASVACARALRCDISDTENVACMHTMPGLAEPARPESVAATVFRYLCRLESRPS